MAGYIFTIAFMLVAWFVANVSPGWEAVPFLSEELPLVLWLFDFSLVKPHHSLSAMLSAPWGSSTTSAALSRSWG